VGDWLAPARRPDVVGRARRVASIVANLRLIVDDGGRLPAGDPRTPDPVKMALTWRVPHRVSTFPAVQAIREGAAAPAPSVKGDGSAPPGSSGWPATSRPP
jgi:hypothetical protein